MGLTPLDRTQEDDSKGNIYTNALPPWLMTEPQETSETDSRPVGPNIEHWEKYKKFKKKSLLNADRVGAKFDHQTEQSKSWLPSFGGVWQHSARSHSVDQFNRRINKKDISKKQMPKVSLSKKSDSVFCPVSLSSQSKTENSCDSSHLHPHTNDANGIYQMSQNVYNSNAASNFNSSYPTTSNSVMLSNSQTVRLNTGMPFIPNHGFSQTFQPNSGISMNINSNHEIFSNFNFSSEIAQNCSEHIHSNFNSGMYSDATSTNTFSLQDKQYSSTSVKPYVRKRSSQCLSEGSTSSPYSVNGLKNSPSSLHNHHSSSHGTDGERIQLIPTPVLNKNFHKH